MLEFKIDGHKLKRIDEEILANKSRNLINAHFTFTDDTVIFSEVMVYFTSETGKTYSTFLKSDYTCIIPSEVMLDNYFKISLTVNDRVTTNYLKVFMTQSSYSPILDKSDADTDVLFELIDDVNDLKDEMKKHTHTSEQITDLKSFVNNDIGIVLGKISDKIAEL